MAADETPDVPGHVDPDPGTDSPPESEIPVGVDSLTDEQIAQADEAGPAGGGDEGDDGALDVSALMDDSGDDDADAGDDAGGGDEGDAGDDADAGEPTADDDTAGPDAAEEEA